MKTDKVGEGLAENFFAALEEWKTAARKEKEEEERYGLFEEATSVASNTCHRLKRELEVFLVANLSGYRVEINPHYPYGNGERVARICGPHEAPPQQLVQSLRSLGFKEISYRREFKTTTLW